MSPRYLSPLLVSLHLSPPHYHHSATMEGGSLSDSPETSPYISCSSTVLSNFTGVQRQHTLHLDWFGRLIGFIRGFLFLRYCRLEIWNVSTRLLPVRRLGINYCLIICFALPREWFRRLFALSHLRYRMIMGSIDGGISGDKWIYSTTKTSALKLSHTCLSLKHLRQPLTINFLNRQIRNHRIHSRRARENTRIHNIQPLRLPHPSILIHCAHTLSR